MAAPPLLMRAVVTTTWRLSASHSRQASRPFGEGQAWGGQGQMKYGKGIFAGAVTAVLGVQAAAAQDTDIASAGNGGVATAAGNGGAVSAGDINSGGNVGSAIAVGNSYGDDPDVYGGDILNATSLG